MAKPQKAFSQLTEFCRIVFTDFPKLFLLLLVTVSLSSVLELVGFTAMLPALDLLTVKSESEYNAITLALKDVFSTFGIELNLESLLISFLFIFFLKGAMVYGAKFLQEKIRILVALDFRSRSFRAIFKAGWPFFISRKVGDLLNGVITQTRSAAGAIKFLANLISSLCFITVYAVLAAYLSWQIVCVCLATVGLMFLVLRKIFNNVHKIGKKAGDLEGEINQISTEAFSAPKYIKGSGIELKFINRFLGSIKNSKIYETFYAKYDTLMFASAEPISVFAGCAILYVSIKYFQETFAEVVIVVLLFFRIYQRVATIPRCYAGVLYYIPVYKLCHQLIIDAEKEKEIFGQRGFTQFSESIEFKNVMFEYNSDVKVLKGIDLVIKKGEFVGLTGKSGGGKTTLINLILGLQKPTSGQVIIDGHPVEDYNLHTLRGRLGYVPQESFLFNLTVKENITIGVENASEEDMIKAAKDAYAHEFIMALPNQYDTLIGERGLALSGGQRQRLSLARALIRKPDILILDEATSNLDNESEAMIQQSINKLKDTITVIAIAHRFKTIEESDHIIVLDQGKIVEEGSYQELTLSQGAFQQLKSVNLG